MSSEPESRRDRRTAVIIVGAFFLADGFLRSLYSYFEGRTLGSERLFADTLVSELTASLGAAIAFFVVIVPMCRRWPLRGPDWPGHLVPHAGGVVAYSLLKTLLMWALRVVAFPVVGLGSYDYGDLVFRFPMEGAGDVVGYVILAAAVHVWGAWKRSREREVRTARLEAQLAAARLTALKSQIQPHFLFNTLNTIASLVHEQPETADRMITRLSDLLRRTLDAPAAAEVTVREEAESLHEYLEIMRARYGSRLRVDVEVDPDVRRACVPPFLLQPLVENAIQHGVAERLDGGSIRIAFGRSGDRLAVRVEDDGPGLGDEGEVPRGGVGIANTRDRLRILYGTEASLSVEDRAGGGVVSLVTIPLRNGAPASAIDP